MHCNAHRTLSSFFPEPSLRQASKCSIVFLCALYSILSSQETVVAEKPLAIIYLNVPALPDSGIRSTDEAKFFCHLTHLDQGPNRKRPRARREAAPGRMYLRKNCIQDSRFVLLLNVAPNNRRLVPQLGAFAALTSFGRQAAQNDAADEARKAGGCI